MVFLWRWSASLPPHYTQRGVLFLAFCQLPSSSCPALLPVRSVMSGLGERPPNPGYEPVPALRGPSGCQDPDKTAAGSVACTPV